MESTLVGPFLVLTRPMRWPFPWAQILSRDFPLKSALDFQDLANIHFLPTHQHVPSILTDSLRVYPHVDHTGTTKLLMESVRGLPIRVSLQLTQNLEKLD